MRGFTLCVFAVLLASATSALTLRPGDIIVGDPDADAVFHIDPLTGAQTVIASAPILQAFDVAVSGDGIVYAALSSISVGGAGGILRIDPETGSQTMLSEGGLLTTPVGIAFDQNGDLLVSDQGTGGANPVASSVVRVNRITGAQQLVSSGGMFVLLRGIAVGDAGEIFVGDKLFGTSGANGAIFRVDGETGGQSLVSTHGFLPASCFTSP